MEVYFGKVDLNEFPNLDDTENLFKYRDNYYWFRCVIEDDQICLHDSCNRHFPVGLEHIVQLSKIVNCAKSYREYIDNADSELEDLQPRLDVMELGTWNK